MIPVSADATVATTTLAAGLAAGLAVLCLPRSRQGADPSSRLTRLVAPAAPVAAAGRQLRTRWSARLGSWTAGRGERRQAEASSRIAPLAADLLAACLVSGSTPSWRPLGAEPGLLPLSQAATRACLTGAPPAEAVSWTADDLRAAHHSAGTATARQAGVRAVAPLTGCFLPAFLLIGVIPVVIGLAQKLLP